MIKNLGPIKEADLDLRRVNVFIGPQAGGKSTIAKAVYLWKSLKGEYFFPHFFKSEENLIPRFERFAKEYLYEFFPDSSWRRGANISIEIDELIKLDLKRLEKGTNVKLAGKFWLDFLQSPSEMSRKRIGNFDSIKATEIEKYLADLGVELNHSKSIVEAFVDSRARLFIPASRSLISVLAGQTLNSVKFDPWMGEFIAYINDQKQWFENGFAELLEKIEDIKGGDIDKVVSSRALDLCDFILKGRYETGKGFEGIRITEDVFIKISEASSGQQEAVGLLMVLFHEIAWRNKTFVVIEEPEAHLYPEAQKAMVELLSLMAHAADNQLIITTHSPYILSAFNNLLYAHQVGIKEGGKYAEQVSQLIPRETWLAYEDIGAYFVADGGIRSIMDEELKQIKAEEIDSASDLINQTYDQLLDLDHEDL